MPLDERTVMLEGEIDAQTDRMEAKAEEQASYPQGSDGARQAAQAGQQAERFRTGLNWFAEEYDAESVTFGAITHGERQLIEDVAADLAGDARSSAYVAVATRDAPYLEHDPDRAGSETASVKQTVANIADMHPAFVDWAESKIHDLGSLGADEGNGYRALVRERRASES